MFRVVAALAVLALAAVASFAGAAPPLEDYGKTRAMDHVSLSPSGAAYAYVVNEDGKSGVFVVTSDGRPPLGIDAGAAEITSLSWAGDDHLLIETTATSKLGRGFTTDKARMNQVTVFNLRTHAAFKVFDRKASQVAPIVEGDYGAREVDGHWLGYFAGFSEDRQSYRGGYATHRDLFRVDLDTGDTHVASRGSDQYDNWLVGPGGDVVARAQAVSETGDWMVLAGPSGLRVLASGRSALKVGEISLGRTPDELLLMRPVAQKSDVTWQTLPFSGGPVAEVPHADAIDSMIADRTTGLWIGTVGFGDRPQAQFFSPDLQARARTVYAAFPNQAVLLTSWSADFSKVIVFVTGADSGTYYLVDLTTHKADPVGYAYPTIEPKDVGPVRMIDYTASDGTALHAVLTLPPGPPRGTLPLVVLPHGGMEDRDYPVFDPLAQALASRGYAVVQPNSRGSGGYSTAFTNAGYGELGRGIETDIAAAVTALGSRGLIDPKRVCIVGSGWGGYSAVAGVTLFHGLYRCAAAVRGTYNLQPLILDEDSEAARFAQSMLGATSRYDPVADARSPLKAAARADAPVLLVYSNDDLAKPDSQSEAMAAALRAAAKPVEELVLPNGDSRAAAEANRMAVIKALVAFVEQYNPPDASPAGQAAN